MAEVELLGHKIDVPGGQTGLLIIAGGGLLAVLALSRRGAAPAPSMVGGFSTPPGSDQNAEFQRIALSARAELEQLTASNKLEEKRIAAQENLAKLGYAAQARSEKRNSQLYQRTCIPWSRWNKDFDGRGDVFREAAQGKIIIQPSKKGVCFLPTMIGDRGHLPPTVTNSRTGFFGSSAGYTAVPEAGSVYTPTPGPTGFGQLMAAIVAYFAGQQRMDYPTGGYYGGGYGQGNTGGYYGGGSDYNWA